MTTRSARRRQLLTPDCTEWRYACDLKAGDQILTWSRGVCRVVTLSRSQNGMTIRLQLLDPVKIPVFIECPVDEMQLAILEEASSHA